MTRSADRNGSNPLRRLSARVVALLIALFASSLLARAQARELYMPPMSQLPPIPYKCQSADGSRDFGVIPVRRLPEDQNAAAFKATGEAADTVGSALGDMGYGSPVARIENGVHEIMSTFRCDDPAIRQFESGILQLFAAHMTGR